MLVASDSRRKEVTRHSSRDLPMRVFGWPIYSMNTTKQTTLPPPSTSTSPLALHIRSLRQWYGPHGLEQAQLAELAGISRRILSQYESSRELPRSLECLLAVALALEVSPEALVDPRHLSRLKAQISGRRAAQLRCPPRVR